MGIHIQGSEPLSPVSSRIDAHRFGRRAASPSADAPSPAWDARSPLASPSHLRFEDDFVDLGRSQGSASAVPASPLSRFARSLSVAPPSDLVLPHPPSLADSDTSATSDTSDTSDASEATEDGFVPARGARERSLASARSPSPVLPGPILSPRPPSASDSVRPFSAPETTRIDARAALEPLVAERRAPVRPTHEAARLVLGSVAATLGAVALASHTREWWQPSLEAALAVGRRQLGEHVVNPLSEALLAAGSRLGEWGYRPPVPTSAYNPLSDWHEIAERVQRLGVAIDGADLDVRPWLEPG